MRSAYAEAHGCACCMSLWPFYWSKSMGMSMMSGAMLWIEAHGCPRVNVRTELGSLLLDLGPKLHSACV